MPALIIGDPMKRYKKKRTLCCSTQFRSKMLVERNEQDYILVKAPLRGVGLKNTNADDGNTSDDKDHGKEEHSSTKPNHIERVIQNVMRISHPHIVSVYEGYLWNDHCYWIMKDWTKGGVVRGHGIGGSVMQEDEIARIIFQLCSALRCMHEAGIPHGNLAFDDLYFFRCFGEIDFKIADLGLSRFIDPEAYAEHVSQQPLEYANPPEAAKGEFTAAGDVWTIGSVAFCLLTGDLRHTSLPDREEEEVDFRSELSSKSNRSDEARDFVMQCLQTDPTDRISCEDALCHPWFMAQHGRVPKIDLPLVQTLRRAYLASSFKRLAAAVLVKHVEPDFVTEYVRAFERINVSGSGFISYEEFRIAFTGKTGAPEEEEEEEEVMSKEEAQKMFEYIDFKKDGRICFVEFVAACIQFRTDIPDTELVEAFDNMDGDGDGFVSPTDLSYVLDFPKQLAEKYFAEVCWSTSKLKLNLEQFKALMKVDETVGVMGWARKASLDLVSTLPELKLSVSSLSSYSIISNVSEKSGISK